MAPLTFFLRFIVFRYRPPDGSDGVQNSRLLGGYQVAEEIVEKLMLPAGHGKVDLVTRLYPRISLKRGYR
jgi:hypothetical protein